MKIILFIAILFLNACASTNTYVDNDVPILLNREFVRPNIPQPQKNIPTPILPPTQQNSATQLSKLSKSELASRHLKIKNMPTPELISRQYTLESERILKTRDPSDIEKELIMVNEQLILISPEKALQDKINADNKIIRDKNEKQRQQTQIIREQCLSSGQIGICQSSNQNQVQFLCGQNIFTTFENIFNQYCYMTDNLHITSTMEVRNNLTKSVKDITFSCTQYAKSGTALASNTHTIYDVWNANQSKVINLKFFKNQQVSSMKCRASSWR